jgi:hypothetical protein
MAPRSDPAGAVVVALDTVEDDPQAAASNPAPVASAPPKKIRRSNGTPAGLDFELSPTVPPLVLGSLPG